MLREERHQYILEKLRIHHKVLSSELSQQLQVSEDTIRRDLKELADSGQVRKVHGGALARSPNPHRYKDREHYAQEDKQFIARKAVKLIKNGQVIIMDGGTTTLEIARLLPPELRVTIFTNSLPLVAQLAEHPGAEVIMAGGKLFKDSMITFGAECINTFRSVRADLCMLGICSLHHEIGLSTPNRDEAQVKNEMIAASDQVVALATHEKIGTAESYIVASLSLVDTLVTNIGHNDPVLLPYRKLGIEVV
jgi:DeoR/GlpR family transcriptional regulator of sugar metabolism